jgi:hypothetical protein
VSSFSGEHYKWALVATCPAIRLIRHSPKTARSFTSAATHFTLVEDRGLLTIAFRSDSEISCLLAKSRASRVAFEDCNPLMLRRLD